MQLSLPKSEHLFFRDEKDFRDAQTCITVKENTVSKIVAILRKIAESGRMLELVEMLA